MFLLLLDNSFKLFKEKSHFRYIGKELIFDIMIHHIYYYQPRPIADPNASLSLPLPLSLPLSLSLSLPFLIPNPCF